QLQAKFRLFADALCKEYTATTRAMETPLFVMCIDDADMKPLVSVRLLEALRVLYHPRVAFLLTGNSDLFVNMLTDSFFAGLRAPLRRLDLTGDTSDEMSDRSVALRLAREVYGKVIPTAHRVDVSRLSAAERYRILDDVVKRVGPRLDRTSREAISGVASNEYPLKWYFENDKYTLNALPEQLRDMWSLRDFVREEIERAEAMESRDNESSPDVIDHQVFPISTALKLWRDALADSLLPPPLAEMLRQVIRIETHPTFRFLVDNSRLEKNILSVPIRNYRHADGSTTTFRRIVGYEMWLEGRREAVLSPSAEGAVILASDLAADYADGGFVEHPLSPDEFDNPFVTVGLQSRVARGIVDVVWPMPDWDSFVDFHIFSDAWYEIAQQETAHRETSVSQSDLNHLITRLAKRFLRLVLDIIVDRKAGLLPEVRPLDSALDDWPRLAAEIANVAFTFKAANPTARDIINTRWARSRAALLVAPESRLEQQQAIAFGAALSHEFSHVGAAERHLLKDEIEIARGERLLRSYVHTGKESGVTISAVAQKELQTRDFPGTRVKRAHILDRLIAEIDSHSRDAAANWKNFIQTLGQ
ncbi:MAG TPA: hypothetical protein VE010_20275, partial [Thermoanaerobaculia bacterium]|nr:hypothetical protein [Thermoanaerobaculia bacterium]